MTNLLAFLSLLGGFSVGIIMIVLARLSQRLGHVTHARAHYVWLYFAAILVWIGSAGQILMLGHGMDGGLELQQELQWVLLVKGLPAVGVTIAIIIAWHYWSWLLAERN